MYDTGVHAELVSAQAKLEAFIEGLEQHAMDNPDELVLLERLRIAGGLMASVSQAIYEQLMA